MDGVFCRHPVALASYEILISNSDRHPVALASYEIRISNNDRHPVALASNLLVRVVLYLSALLFNCVELFLSKISFLHSKYCRGLHSIQWNL